MGTLALPKIIGHRGVAGLAPENTLAGFRLAAALAVRWVEFDVRLSRDGWPIVFHDDDLDRTTDAIGLVRDHDLEQLRKLDAGSWFGPLDGQDFSGERIPTLTEALAVIAEAGLGVNIEIKPDTGREAETARIAIETAQDCWPAAAPPPLLSSFSRIALTVARDLAPDWPRGLLVNGLPADWRKAARDLDCRTVNVNHRMLDTAAVAAVKQEGYDLLAYTVNDRDRARRLWQMGVDAVFSDRPDRIAQH